MTQRASWIGRIVLLASLGLAGSAIGEEPKPPRLETKGDVARWNDRSNPRKMLETFFFAIYVYDLAPELILNAIDCLELGDMDPQTRERDAALMAHELNGIIARRSDVSLFSVPAKPSGDRVILAEGADALIAIVRQPDGSWRFSRETVERIPKMRAAAAESQREVQAARSKLAEGRTDPEATLRSFIYAALVKQDFGAASRCLDLRDLPVQSHALHGPDLARKLVFVMQRCGFAFPQEFPSDPDGWRFIWHSNHRGRIMLDRVRMEDGKDAWLFSRMTLHNLDALVEGFRDQPADPRYARVGRVIEPEMLTVSQVRVPPPSNVPANLGSPRATLGTFFQAIDELEYDDQKARDLLGCMDLEELPLGDRTSVGLRLAAKLRAILRPLNLDLQTISDSWETESVRLNPEGLLALTLARQVDGAWRFDRQSVAHVSQLFGQLSAEEKGSLERPTPFSSAQHTVQTLVTAAKRGDLALAAECLDLEQIPGGARAELGPALAFKLNYVLQRLGRLVLPEIPNEPDGPRYYLYRGTLGRISLAREAEAPREGDWLFTDETVRQVDAMFQAVLLQAPANASDPAVTAPAWGTRLPMAMRLRAAMPPGLLFPVLGLCVYQWIGLAIVVLASLPPAWLFLRLVNVGADRYLHAARFNVGGDFVAHKLRPLGLQIAIWVLYLQLPLLDLPIDVVGQALPTFKVLWVGLLAWTLLRLIDVGMALYAGSEHEKVRNNLNDMIVPTGARCLKLAVLIAAVCYQVSLIGDGEWLTKLLAGMGLVGLAASLAAQDTLKNFFGTLLLIGEHPFKIGDQIVVGGIEGTVESVGFRSTRIRTAEDSLATVPNSLIAGTSIDNRGLRKARRYRLLLPLSYDTPIDRMAALRDGLREVATNRPDLVRADRVDVHIFALGAANVDLLVNVYFWADTSRDEMEARDWLNREILALAERLDVEIARPVEPSSPSTPPRAAAPAQPTPPAPKFAAKEKAASRAEA